MTEGVIDLASLLLGGPTGQSNTTDPYTPLSYPLEPAFGIREIEWQHEEARPFTESPYTFHRQTFPHAGERWRATIVLPQMTRERAAELRALLLNLDGGYGTFLFGDPFETLPRGSAFGSPVVNGAGQSGKNLYIRGLNTNVAGIFKAADRIQLGQRLHELRRDVDSDGSGEAILDIWPRLRETPSDGQTVIARNARGLFQLSGSGGTLFRRGLSGAYELPTIEIVEAL